MMKEKWYCPGCQWCGFRDEVKKEIVFHATREEPDEWEWYCPDCNRTDLEECQEILCEACEEVVVKSDGDRCQEFSEEHADYLRDKRKDDFLTGDDQ